MDDEMEHKKKKLCDADRVIAQFFPDDAPSYYGDEFPVVLKAVRLHQKQKKLPASTTRIIEKHAKAMYAKLFQNRPSDDKETLNRIRSLLQAKIQHPAIMALCKLLHGSDPLPSLHRLTPHQKKIIDEAFAVLELPANARADFIKVITDLAKNTR